MLVKVELEESKGGGLPTFLVMFQMSCIKSLALLSFKFEGNCSEAVNHVSSILGSSCGVHQSRNMLFFLLHNQFKKEQL